MEAGEINLLDPLIFEDKVPHEWFTWLRHEAPIFRHPEPGGPGFWVITRYDDVVEVGRDGVNYSSEQSRGGVVALEDVEAAGRPVVAGPHDAHDGRARSHALPLAGKSRIHTAHDQRAQRSHPRDGDEILDPALEKRDCDFVTDVAAELPLQVIAEMLGVPYEDRHKLFEWSNRMIGSKDPEYAVSQDKVQQAAIEMYMYSNELAKQRREEPRDDIVTALLKADLDGDQLSEMDFNVFFLLLAVAGNETTRNAMSHGMHALIEHPEQFAMLVDESRAGAVGHRGILRWASPVMFFRRNVTRDTELRGQKIKAGDKVSIWYISANRDEEIFSDPFTFDIRRTPNEHVAFGGGGPHFCLGASLARMEMSILFEELVKRIASVERTGPVKRLRSNFINGLKHLPVRITPRARKAA